MKGPRDYYKHGDQNAYCDECGFKFKLSELHDRWDGARVDEKCWEPRHPRDFPQIPRVEKPGQPGTGNESTDNTTNVTYAVTPTVPSGTFDADSVS